MVRVNPAAAEAPKLCTNQMWEDVGTERGFWWVSLEQVSRTKSNVQRKGHMCTNTSVWNEFRSLPYKDDCKRTGFCLCAIEESCTSDHLRVQQIVCDVSSRWYVRTEKTLPFVPALTVPLARCASLESHLLSVKLHFSFIKFCVGHNSSLSFSYSNIVFFYRHIVHCKIFYSFHLLIYITA